jgi:SAM-dependent methyltransferase
MSDPDELYTKVWPEYFETQQKDLFWYERLWRVLLDRLGRPRNRLLLDYGSGPGFLLAMAQRSGWCVYGIETSPVAREHAKGLGVRSGISACLQLQDAVISTEVLEHTVSPPDELRKMHSGLAHGGLLALSVPNDDNPLQALFFGKKQPWIHHTHKHYFNPCSLRRLVEAAGFEVTWTRTSFPVELLLILPIPRKWAWKLSRVWPAPPFLWRLNIGRHVLMIARKK